jgi:hypothetical protein
MQEELLVMKRLILRFTVAILAFGFGLAIDRVLVSPVQKPRTVWKLEPVVSTPVPACPASTSTPLTTRALGPRMIFHYNPTKFDPKGTYYPLSPLPKDFAEFDIIELAVDESASEVLGSAIVQTRTNDMYDAQTVTFLVITERRLFLVASSVSETQFEYRFDGEFLGNPGRLVDTGKPALRGTLTKMRDGRKVAERVISFDVRYLGC